MKNFKFLPSETEIKTFQNDWFLKEHIAVILPMNRRFPTPRETSPYNRKVPYTVSTRVVKAFKKSVCSVVTLKIKLLRACVDNISFVAYHIDNKGIVIDKENGRVVCFAEGDFSIIEINNDHNLIAVVNGNNCKVIEKVNDDKYTIDEVETFSSMEEKKVTQNGELMGLFNIKEQAYSWDACFYHKFVLKNLEAIEKWEVEE